LAKHSIQYPKLRNIEVFPVEYEGQEFICLRDPGPFSDGPMFVNPGAGPILGLLDGRHSRVEIQAAYTRHNGGFLPIEQLDELVNQLDGKLLLDSDRFRQTRNRIHAEFHDASVRTAAHAGAAYAGESEELRRQIDGFYTDPAGPGKLPQPGSDRDIKALIAPHIDFSRGGACYAWAYRELAASLDAELFIIFGIGHEGPDHLFSMTSKDFITPFGTMRTDREFVTNVREACPFDVLADEFLHKNEHSVEFQVVFLQHLMEKHPNVMIVPVLCGSFYEMVGTGTPPSDHPHFVGFVRALKQAIDASGKRVCLIAGVDLAHIGRHFGDEKPLSDAWLQSVREADLDLLRHVENLDAEAFYAHICEDRDQRRICGYPAIYTLMTLTEAREGELLKYDQAADKTTQQAVTYASMVLK